MERGTNTHLDGVDSVDNKRTMRGGCDASIEDAAEKSLEKVRLL